MNFIRFYYSYKIRFIGQIEFLECFHFIAKQILTIALIFVLLYSCVKITIKNNYCREDLKKKIMKGKRYYTSDNDGHLFTFFRLFIPTTLTNSHVSHVNDRQNWKDINPWNYQCEPVGITVGKKKILLYTKQNFDDIKIEFFYTAFLVN